MNETQFYFQTPASKSHLDPSMHTRPSKNQERSLSRSGRLVLRAHASSGNLKDQLRSSFVADLASPFSTRPNSPSELTSGLARSKVPTQTEKKKENRNSQRTKQLHGKSQTLGEDKLADINIRKSFSNQAALPQPRSRLLSLPDAAPPDTVEWLAKGPSSLAPEPLRSPSQAPSFDGVLHSGNMSALPSPFPEFNNPFAAAFTNQVGYPPVAFSVQSPRTFETPISSKQIDVDIKMYDATQTPPPSPPRSRPPSITSSPNLTRRRLYSSDSLFSSIADVTIRGSDDASGQAVQDAFNQGAKTASFVQGPKADPDEATTPVAKDYAESPFFVNTEHDEELMARLSGLDLHGEYRRFDIVHRLNTPIASDEEQPPEVDDEDSLFDEPQKHRHLEPGSSAYRPRSGTIRASDFNKPKTVPSAGLFSASIAPRPRTRSDDAPAPSLLPSASASPSASSDSGLLSYDRRFQSSGQISRSETRPEMLDTAQDETTSPPKSGFNLALPVRRQSQQSRHQLWREGRAVAMRIDAEPLPEQGPEESDDELLLTSRVSRFPWITDQRLWTETEDPQMDQSA